MEHFVCDDGGGAIILMRRIYHLLLSCVLFTTLVIVPEVRAQGELYDSRVQFADGLYSRGMYELAIKEYAALLKNYPGGSRNDAVTFRLAESLRLKGDTGNAARFYAHLVAQYRESPFRLRAAYRRARLYADAGDYESAEAHFAQILKLSPPAELAAATTYYLGEVQLSQKKLDIADQTFAKVLDEFTDSEFAVYALLKRGEIKRLIYIEAKEQSVADSEASEQEALEYYEAALAKASTDRLKAEVLFQMADLYFRDENYQQSADLYRQLMSQYPDDERAVQARLQAAWAALRSNLYAEALRVADQALADSPTGEAAAEWLYVKANCQRQLIQTETAVATYRQLLERFPDSRFADSARYETAVAHYQAGSFSKAVMEAEKIRLTPELRADVCWLLAESYAALDMPAEATQYYRMVVREGGAGSRARDALYRLAHQLQQQGAYRDASSFYLRLVDSFPEDELAAQALFASGYCLSMAGDLEAAVRDWSQLVQRYASSPLVEEALYQKAMGEVRLERAADALGSLAELQRLYPQGRYLSDAYYWQGMLMFEGDNPAEAEPALRQAVQRATRDDLRREAMFQLGLVLQRLGKDEQSAQMLQELIDSPLSGRFPPSLLEWMAAFHGQKGDYVRMSQTADVLTTSAEKPWQQAGWVLKGRAARGQQQADQAIEAFEQALAIRANTQYAGEAALALARLCLEGGNLDKAETYFNEASTRGTGERAQAIQAHSVMGLGRVAQARNQSQDASRLFMSVAILYEDGEIVPDALLQAAVEFEKLDRLEERDKVVAELQARYPDSTQAAEARERWLM